MGKQNPSAFDYVHVKISNDDVITINIHPNRRYTAPITAQCGDIIHYKHNQLNIKIDYTTKTFNVSLIINYIIIIIKYTCISIN